MVFIHGGGFSSMSAASLLYQGDVFVSKGGVILVTVNYRLGVLGFLVTDGGVDPAIGNYGLQDQRMALQWIQNNIESFGGDPGKVTLFGQSAGAQSIAIHMMSYKADDLFRAAILQSHPFSIPMKSRDEAVAQGIRVANIVNCSSHDIACLRGKSWQVLAIAQSQAGGSEGTIQRYQRWGPHIDGDELAMQPILAFLMGRFVQKPLILGTLSEEGVLYVMGSEPFGIIPYNRNLQSMFGRGWIHVYRRYPPFWILMGDMRPQMTAISTDFIFTCPSLAVARSVSGSSNPPEVWHYIFDHAFSFDGWGQTTFCKGRVCHGGELAFVFQTAELGGYQYTPDELDLSDSVISYWTNFAKHGNPNPPSNASNYAEWPVYNPSSRRSMRLTVPTNLIIHKHMERTCAFWDMILSTL